MFAKTERSVLTMMPISFMVSTDHLKYSTVAQMVEQPTVNRRAAGSSPAGRAKFERSHKVTTKNKE